MREVETNLPEFIVKVALERGHMITDKETAAELTRIFREYTNSELWGYVEER